MTSDSNDFEDYPDTRDGLDTSDTPGTTGSTDTPDAIRTTDTPDTLDAPRNRGTTDNSGTSVRRLVVTLLSVVALAGGTVAAVGASAHFVPQAAEIDMQSAHGDQALIDTAAPHLSGVRRSVAIMTLEPGVTRQAMFDASARSFFEIGPISSALTMQLYMDAVRRHEVNPSDPLSEYLPVSGDIAQVRLGELATGSADLPQWVGDTGWQWWNDTVRRQSGYADMSQEQFLTALSAIKLPSETASNPGDRSSSKGRTQSEKKSGGKSASATAGNPASATEISGLPPTSVALLGLVLAAKAEVPYGQLLKQRELDRLGMQHTGFPTSTSLNVPRGLTAEGHPAQSWAVHAGAYTSANGVVSTPQDMAIFAKYILESISAKTIGKRKQYGGFAVDSGGDEVLLRSAGHTPGFASAMIIAPESGRAVVVLADSSVSVEAVAQAVFDAGAEGAASEESAQSPATAEGSKTVTSAVSAASAVSPTSVASVASTGLTGLTGSSGSPGSPISATSARK